MSDGGTWSPKSAVVIGASSDLARSVLRKLAAKQLRSVVLAGRKRDALEEVASELRSLGVETRALVDYDTVELDDVDSLVEQTKEALREIDLVLVAVGRIDREGIDSWSPSYVAEQITTNFTGPAATISAFARVLGAQGRGRIVVFSSAAAMRVRRGLVAYGAAKAGLDGFCQGLGDTLEGSGVGITIVRPGFVYTKMTNDRHSMPLATGPDEVADRVVRGIEKGERIVWSPPLLRPLFAVAVHLPARVWRRLS